MKIFLIFFFYTQKLKITIIQNTKKDSEKKYVKEIKIFLKRKKKKGGKRPKRDIKI